MSVIIFVLIALALSLVISLVLPGCLDDMNVGFYLLVTLIFASSAAIVMMRKSFKFFKTLTWYILVFLLLFIAGETALIYYSADDIPTGNEQAIIVAGGGLFVESRLTDELEERLDLALKVYEKNPQLPIVLSGGTDENRALPQSTAMKAYLDKQVKELGITSPQVIIDDKTSGLYNNVKTSLELVEKNPSYIIVSRHNVARTKIMTYRLSPASTVLGAEYPISKYIIYYIRELGYAIKTAVWDGLIK
ncbi:MAG: YdcF family protein [Clostridia bacterium]|nr:YdcF family protein [Clostridia bacterium]